MCFLCANAENEEVKKIPAFVSEQIALMSVESICQQVRDHLDEQQIATLQVSDIYDHITKHVCNRKIDTFVALQDLKGMSQTVKQLTHTADENTGTVVIDPKLLGIYLDTVKQVMALHKTV